MTIGTQRPFFGFSYFQNRYVGFYIRAGNVSILPYLPPSPSDPSPHLHIYPTDRSLASNPTQPNLTPIPIPPLPSPLKKSQLPIPAAPPSLLSKNKRYRKEAPYTRSHSLRFPAPVKVIFWEGDGVGELGRGRGWVGVYLVLIKVVVGIEVGDAKGRSSERWACGYLEWSYRKGYPASSYLPGKVRLIKSAEIARPTI